MMRWTTQCRQAPWIGWLLLLAVTLPPLCAQVTETPVTIEPGRFLLRMDAITLGFNRDTTDPNQYTALGVASSLLSTGLTQDVDLQVGVQLFVRDTYQYRGTNTSHSGLGDFTFRAKWTFWRDPASGQAAAVIPYVKVPSRSNGVGNGHTEGGIIVPWSTSPGAAVNAGAMFQWDMARNPGNTRYDTRWFASGYVQRNLTQALGLYGEATLAISTAGTSSFAGTLGGGATLNFSKDVQWDYGVSRGLGGRATDWTHVLRLRWKF